MPSKGLRGERDSGVPVGFQALTVSNVAVGLTVPKGVTFGFIEVQDNPIRVFFHGDAPTAAVGHLYIPGQSDVWNENEMRHALAIATGSDATLAVTYYYS